MLIKERNTIIECFEHIVQRYPNRISITFNNERWTYLQLNNAVNNVASNFLACGLNKGDIIGIYMEKDVSYVISMLAILKIGGTYVPLSYNFPDDRIDQMLITSSAKYVITNKKLFNSTKVKNLLYEELIKTPSSIYRSADNIDDENAIAYIVFTSGTTGTPKGIMIQHKGIINLIHSMSNTVLNGQNETTNIGVFAPFIFDASVAQIYLALLTGGNLVIIPDNIKSNIGLTVNYLMEKEVVICDFTPSYLELIVEYCSQIKENDYTFLGIISCGEKLPLDLVRQFYLNDNFKSCTLYNFYGPTECSVYSSVYEITNETHSKLEQVYIGKPLDNTDIYILDELMNKCALNEEGYIYISGVGLAVGYVNDKQLTEKSFIYNPFKEGERLYNTGDRGLLTEGNNLVYIGREDYQVKVRGYRVELSDIEYHLNRVPGIKKSKVTVTLQNGKNIINGYYTSTTTLTKQYIKEKLQEAIPGYMIPTNFIYLKKFDITFNGKLDIQILSNDDSVDLVKYSNSSEISSDEITVKLISIIQKTINLEEINIEDSFFSNGADSLDLFRLNMRISLEWNIVHSMQDLFGFNTIRDFIEVTKKIILESNIETEIVPSEGLMHNNIQATPFQEFLFDLEKKELRKKEKKGLALSSSYNLVYLISSNDYINYEVFKQSLILLINRHEILKSVFSFKEGKHYIHWMDNEINPDEVLKFISCDNIDSVNVDSYKKKVFDITSFPLMEILFFEDKSLKQKILLNFHHCIFDYISLQIFIQELFMMVENINISPKRASYLEYVLNRSYPIERKISDFWRNYYSDRQKAPVFPSDIKFEKQKIYGEHIYSIETFVMDSHMLICVRDFCQLNQISEFILFYSAFVLAVAELSKQTDIIIGTFLPGRNTTDIAEMGHIGLMTEMHGLRFKIEDGKTLLDFVIGTKKNLINVMEYQQISYKEIYHVIDSKDLMNGSLFNLTFNYSIHKMINIPNCDRNIFIEDNSKDEEVLPFGIVGIEYDESVVFNVKYDTCMYSKNGVKNIISIYQEIIDYIIVNPHRILERNEGNGISISGYNRDLLAEGSL